MAQPWFLHDDQLESLLRYGPVLDQVEPLLPASLGKWLADAQRLAADRYAAGQWQGQESGQIYTVADKAPLPKFR